MKGVVFAGNRKIEIKGFPDAQNRAQTIVGDSGMHGSDRRIYRASRRVAAAGSSRTLPRAYEKFDTQILIGKGMIIPN